MNDKEILGGTNWVKKYYDISGHWVIETKEGKRMLVFGDDFKTLRGPDVKVFLSQKHIEDIDKRESVDLEGLFLGEIVNFSGAQSFEIPEDVSLLDFESLVLHCKAFSVVWGGTNRGIGRFKQS